MADSIHRRFGSVSDTRVIGMPCYMSPEQVKVAAHPNPLTFKQITDRASCRR